MNTVSEYKNKLLKNVSFATVFLSEYIYILIKYRFQKLHLNDNIKVNTISFFIIAWHIHSYIEHLISINNYEKSYSIQHNKKHKQENTKAENKPKRKHRKYGTK